MAMEKTPDEKPDVKNERKRVVALGYNPDADSAPRVLASGQGIMADRILEIAREHNLPIQNDPVLAEALSRVDLNQAIPPELYAVVAEIFAFVYRIKEKKVGH